MKKSRKNLHVMDESLKDQPLQQELADRYLDVLHDDGHMAVYLVHNTEFPKTSDKPLCIIVVNPRTGLSFEVPLPDTCEKGTVGIVDRLEAIYIHKVLKVYDGNK